MKKLMKLLVVVATIACMLLSLALTTMAVILEASPGDGPASGPANENSFLSTPITKDDVIVAIGGNGNSARLIVTIRDESYVSTVRPENNKVNIVVLADIGYEVDVFVRGNKIDGNSIVVHDLNCYNECPSLEGCTPKRFMPCECDPDDCGCTYRCDHNHNDVICNVTGQLCTVYELCNENCDRPTDFVDCKKHDHFLNWECTWQCACACECESEGEGQGCDHSKCPTCFGCITDGCDHETNGEFCCDACTCPPVTPPCSHDRLVCSACNDDEGSDAQHQNCINSCYHNPGNYQFFCADCGVRVGSENDNPDWTCMHNTCVQNCCS